jgi:hypothetical protein
VALAECPSVGTIAEAELEDRPSLGSSLGRRRRWFYRIDWPDFTNDHGWYREDELVKPWQDTVSRMRWS